MAGSTVDRWLGDPMLAGDCCASCAAFGSSSPEPGAKASGIRCWIRSATPAAGDGRLGDHRVHPPPCPGGVRRAVPGVPAVRRPAAPARARRGARRRARECALRPLLRDRQRVRGRGAPAWRTISRAYWWHQGAVSTSFDRVSAALVSGHCAGPRDVRWTLRGRGGGVRHLPVAATRGRLGAPADLGSGGRCPESVAGEGHALDGVVTRGRRRSRRMGRPPSTRWNR